MTPRGRLDEAFWRDLWKVLRGTAIALMFAALICWILLGP